MHKAYFIGGPMDGCIKRLEEITKTCNFSTYSTVLVKPQGRFSLTDEAVMPQVTRITHTYVKYGELPQTVGSKERVAIYHYSDNSVPQYDDEQDYRRYRTRDYIDGP